MHRFRTTVPAAFVARATFVTCLLIASASPGVAQTITAPAVARPADPLDAGAAVPPATYRSAFEGYRRFADVEVGPWRGLNDRVGEIGGWRTYSREIAQGAAGAAPGAQAAPPAAAPSGAPASPGGAMPAPAPASAPKGAAGHKH